MIQVAEVDALLDRYETFLIDQFGTLHDGVRAYDGAAAALRRIRAASRRVVLVSNSGRSVRANARRLAAMGLGPDVYDVLITSGELASRSIAEDRLPVARGVSRCLLLERPGDGSILDDIGFAATGPDAAQLVLIAGSEGDRFSLQHYVDLLGPLARRGVPALCVNPDRVTLSPGGPIFGPACIADAYAGLGGEVAWIGKPYPAVYDEALKLAGDPSPSCVAGVGDSVEHDIGGAKRAGCAAWLARTGIIAGWDDAAIAEQCARWRTVPDGMLQAFV